MKRHRLFGSFALVALAAACSSQPPAPPREFDGAAALRYVEAQVAFGPRVPGTEGHQRMAAWLDSLARAKADTVLTQDWVSVTAKGARVSLHNVMMRFNPAAPERILYLAHWDTRPTAEKAINPEDRNKPIPGANDGGSGVAVLLGVADALKKTPSTLGVDLLFVDGEDFGSFEDSTETLLGARYYAKNQAPGPKPLFAVLFDMIGDRDLQIYQEGNSLLGAPEVVERVWDAAKIAGYSKVFIAAPRHTLIDDHLPLQQAGIRAIDVIDYDYGSNNSLWHTPDDTVDKLSAQSLQAVGDVAMAVIRLEAGGKK
jgi:glutaminyl-peptide cyclotransferase